MIYGELVRAIDEPERGPSRVVRTSPKEDPPAIGRHALPREKLLYSGSLVFRPVLFKIDVYALGARLRVW